MSHDRYGMLRISDAQYRALHQSSTREWRMRLAKWLREHSHEALTYDDADLLSLIQRQESRAAKFHIESERGLAMWCYLAITTKERFDELSKVAAHLSDEASGTPDQRIELLLRFYDELGGDSET